MEKWCHVCILEARNRGIRGETVILTDIPHCESRLHPHTPLGKASIEREKIDLNRLRETNGRFAKTEANKK
jgi:hypothetical protein